MPGGAAAASHAGAGHMNGDGAAWQAWRGVHVAAARADDAVPESAGHGGRFARPRLRLMRRMQRQVGARGAGRVVATSCVRAARGGSALAAGLHAGKSAGCAAAQAAARHARRAAQHAPTSFRRQGRWLGVQTLVCGAGGAHCTAKEVGAVWDGGRTAGKWLGCAWLQPRALPRAQRRARVIAPPNEEATWGAF